LPAAAQRAAQDAKLAVASQSVHEPAAPHVVGPVPLELLLDPPVDPLVPLDPLEPLDPLGTATGVNGMAPFSAEPVGGGVVGLMLVDRSSIESTPDTTVHATVANETTNVETVNAKARIRTFLASLRHQA
jgi:hypothetical protein